MQKTTFSTWLWRLFYRTVMGISLALVLAHTGGLYASARTSAAAWTPPVNLSQSGGASNPTLLPDTDGRLHAIWLDEYSGFKYRVGDGTTWEAPQNIFIPVTGDVIKLRFYVTPAGRVVVVWITPEEELYSSIVRLANITRAETWATPVLWGDRVRDFAVEIDRAGGLHLAYLRGESSDSIPAGIYATHNFESASSWSTPVLVYTSPYFRGLTAEDAHLSVASAVSGDQDIVYIAWDHPLRRNLWLARSDDRGSSWGEAVEIVQPAANFGFDVPHDVQIIARDEQVLALWKLGIPGETCTVYAMQTSDRGETWDAPQTFFGQQAGCPEDVQIIDTAGEEIILFTRINSQAYLLARNESGWSIPQYQHELSNFYDPETQRPLDLQEVSVIQHGNNLYLIGSMLPEEGGDIWLATRSLEDQAAWFPSDTFWSNPEEIGSETGEVQTTSVVVDANGNIHAFWNIISGSEIDQSADIFYAVWNGTMWSTPVKILEFPRINAYLHSAAISPEDTIFVTWERRDAQGLSEGLFVSWANNDEASSTSAWVSAEALPESHLSAASARMRFDGSGQIRMIYVLPLNEDRGVYTVTSDDNGRTWSEPVLVADAVSQGWEMIGEPHFAASDTGDDVSVLWTAYSLPPYSRPLGVYASSSFDSGQTWAFPEGVAGGWIQWSQVTRTSEGTFHRLWLINEEKIQNLWHQTSFNNGLTWGAPNNLLITTNSPAITIHADSLGRLHLAMITNEAGHDPRLEHWIWQNDQWQGDDGLQLPAEFEIDADSLAAAFTPQDIFGVTYAGKLPDLSGSERSERPVLLYFAQRGIERPLVTPTSLLKPTERVIEPPATSTPVQSTDTPQATAIPQAPTLPLPSPTPAESSVQPTATPPASSSWAGPILIGIVLLAVALVAFAVHWIMRNRK